MTVDELLELPDDGKRYELIEGELRMTAPAGSRHGRLAMRVGSSLEQHVHSHDLGAVYAAETGFVLSHDPDTVRAPDVAFVSKQRLTEVPDTEGYPEPAPDPAVEVIAPDDTFMTFMEVEEKAVSWLKAGSRMVLVVNSSARTVHVYRSTGVATILREEHQLDAHDVVPGWRVPVREFFA